MSDTFAAYRFRPDAIVTTNVSHAFMLVGGESYGNVHTNIDVDVPLFGLFGNDIYLGPRAGLGTIANPAVADGMSAVHAKLGLFFSGSSGLTLAPTAQYINTQDKQIFGFGLDASFHWYVADDIALGLSYNISGFSIQGAIGSNKRGILYIEPGITVRFEL